ncbi:energy-coupling factor ABC transporter ATP-binding protein [Maritimibacter sp. DP1N21-5]|uniref:energy-coupling factor ABC transporter ATP-binding protein n=1 Tax=Maritimibacter sp. DP1N21-5 TaxID=2836867 RepID=UPI001C445D77|nr:ABC transporter ATP-binding protein [Maritimibacter sp. DP1N21-5]MBV7407791.1 energy-coupling factor ABC transporter ATP-binding protein [Maritimibacter sp. DP1N21-5]
MHVGRQSVTSAKAIATMAGPGTARVAWLNLSGVTLRIDGRTIIDNLSCDIRERRVGIVGRNGSGKTTLARLIAGLQKPDSGRVEIDGADMLSDRRAALSHVGILFQNPEHQIIFPTVEEELAFGLLQQGQSREDAAEGVARVLARFGRSDWRDAATATLSQGQKQLVCLMAVLAMRPRLIVLDEPYSGLDIPTRRQLMRHVDQVEASVVQITHDPDSVADCDRVLWIDKGAIRRDGPAPEVLAEFCRTMEAWGDDDDLAHLAS